jgi:hypothetical protein
MNEYTYPIHTGSQKNKKENLPPGLQGIVTVIKSKASKWNEEEYIIFTMKCSYNMTLKIMALCVTLKTYSGHKKGLNS